MFHRKIGLLLSLLLLLSSCGFSASKEDVTEVMTQYFTAIEAQDYLAAMEYYAASFFKEASREAWEAQLQKYNRQLGDLESFEAVNWNVKKNVGANAGTFVQVIYKTHYSRHPAVEKFILKKAAVGFRIIAHRIDAKALPKGKTEFI
jgi:hypothetical protein